MKDYISARQRIETPWKARLLYLWLWVKVTFTRGNNAKQSG
jgi:hypothetical protein